MCTYVGVCVCMYLCVRMNAWLTYTNNVSVTQEAYILENGLKTFLKETINVIKNFS